MKKTYFERTPSTTRYSNGLVKTFNPFFRWRIMDGWWHIGFPRHFGFGIMWKFRKGEWSRIRTKFVVFGRWTLYIDLGQCKPCNPRTGKIYKSPPMADADA